MRNLSSKSIILAPFNTTKSDLNKKNKGEQTSEGTKKWILDTDVRELLIDKQSVIKFGIRVKEIDKNYELNNNCDLDNGVFNKFA